MAITMTGPTRLRKPLRTSAHSPSNTNIAGTTAQTLSASTVSVVINSNNTPMATMTPPEARRPHGKRPITGTCEGRP